MQIASMRSEPIDDGNIKVFLETTIDGKEKNFKAVGETLLGAIGNAFCRMLDDEVGEIKNERLLMNAVRGPYEKRLVTMRLLAEHEGKEKEVLNSGEGLLETIINALRTLKTK